jgi:hypothetical protein
VFVGQVYNPVFSTHQSAAFTFYSEDELTGSIESINITNIKGCVIIAFWGNIIQSEQSQFENHPTQNLNS